MPRVELPAGDETATPTRRIELSDAEGSFGVRAGVSLRSNQEGRLNFLKSLYGEDNVRIVNRSPLLEGSDESQIFIRDPKVSSKFFPLDSSKVTLADFTADIVGPAIATAPTLLVGASARNVALAAAAGEAARQGVSELLPGESAMSIEERLFDVGASAAFAGASQAIVNKAAKVFDVLRPGNWLARKVAKLEAGPFGRAGQELTKRTGIKLTLAEETGSRAAAYAEGIARRDITAVDDFYKFQQGQLAASTQRLQTILDDISGPQGAFEVGEAVTTAFDDAVEKAIELRRTQAAVDFGEVHRLSQGRPVVTASNLAQTIEKWVGELDVPGAGDATAKVLRQAKRLFADIEKSGGQYTAEQTQRLLQIYTDAQRGTGVLLADMDKAQSRLIAGRLKDALLRDLDAAADAGESEIAQALRTARNSYRLNTQAINELGESTLARVIGNGTRSPEAIAEKFLRMQPSEIRSAIGLVERINPSAALAIRRSYVDAAMANAREVAPTRTGASAVRFSAARFLKALPDDDTLRAAGFAPSELADIKDVASVLERIADKSLEGSPTAPIALTWDLVRGAFVGGSAGATIGTLAGGPIGGGIGAVAGGAAGIGLRVLPPRAIARAVMTPEGRQALRTLTQTSLATKKGYQAAITFSAITGVDLAGAGFNVPVDSAQLAESVSEKQELEQ
jgi:hypothetical protein